MANERVKTAGTGKAGAKSSRWTPRAAAKQAAKKQRRAEWRNVQQFEPEPCDDGRPSLFKGDAGKAGPGDAS